MPDAAPPNPHDLVIYPGLSYPQTHPDRLATIGCLFGLEPAPAERCRVLELGCGRGMNLIPMAFGLPDSTFVGLDLAARPVELARAMIAELALANVTVAAGDIAALPPDLGEFDYIIAHGVYSWVPAVVRERLLEVCRQHLAPNGVAYVSYAALPGAQLRLMVRDMVQFHRARPQSAADAPSPIKALTRWLLGATHPQRWHGVLGEELTRFQDRADAAIVHDELCPDYAPLRFTDFAADAARHGLQYLAEAELSDMAEAVRPPELLEELNRWAGDDPVAREQYLDFLKCRGYRQTLLCRQEAPVTRTPRPDRLAECSFTMGNATLVSGKLDGVRSPKPVEFQTAAGSVQSADPGVKAVCKVLLAAAPQALAFAQLRRECAELLGRAAAVELAELPELLLALWQGGVVQGHRHMPPMVTAPGERPVASPVARAQIRHGVPDLTNLRHAPVNVPDPLARHLLLLLDGTRDRPALVDALVDAVRASVAKEKGHPLHQDPAATRSALAVDLDRNLAALAKLALLTG